MGKLRNPMVSKEHKVANPMKGGKEIKLDSPVRSAVLKLKKK